MIFGSHVSIYSKDGDADRKFFKDIMKLPCCDAGGGWLMFGLPPTTLGFPIPSGNDVEGSHKLMLTCPDIEAFVKNMKEHFKIDCSEIKKEPWGQLTTFSLPGGSEMTVYEPSHPLPDFTQGNKKRKEPAEEAVVEEEKKEEDIPPKEGVLDETTASINANKRVKVSFPLFLELAQNLT